MSHGLWNISKRDSLQQGNRWPEPRRLVILWNEQWVPAEQRMGDTWWVFAVFEWQAVGSRSCLPPEQYCSYFMNEMTWLRSFCSKAYECKGIEASTAATKQLKSIMPLPWSVSIFIVHRRVRIFGWKFFNKKTPNPNMDKKVLFGTFISQFSFQIKHYSLIDFYFPPPLTRFSSFWNETKYFSWSLKQDETFGFIFEWGEFYMSNSYRLG